MSVDDIKNIPFKIRQIITIILIVVAAGLFMIIVTYFVAKAINLLRRRKYSRELEGKRNLDVESRVIDYEPSKCIHESANLISDFPPPPSVHVSPRERQSIFRSPSSGETYSSDMIHSPVVISSPFTAPPPVVVPSLFERKYPVDTRSPRPAMAPRLAPCTDIVPCHLEALPASPAVAPRLLDIPCPGIAHEVDIARPFEARQVVVTLTRPVLPARLSLASPLANSVPTAYSPSGTPSRTIVPSPVSKSEVPTGHPSRVKRVLPMNPFLPLDENCISLRSQSIAIQDKRSPRANMKVRMQGQKREHVQVSQGDRPGTPSLARENRVDETTRTTRTQAASRRSSAHMTPLQAHMPLLLKLYNQSSIPEQVNSPEISSEKEFDKPPLRDNKPTYRSRYEKGERGGI